MANGLSLSEEQDDLLCVVEPFDIGPLLHASLRTLPGAVIVPEGAAGSTGRSVLRAEAGQCRH